MEKFVFILGREREIAKKELEAVLRRNRFDFVIEKVEDNVCYLNIKGKMRSVDLDSSAMLGMTKTEASEIIDQLAGTVKIFKMVEERRITGLDKIDQSIKNYTLSIKERERSVDLDSSARLRMTHNGQDDKIGRIDFGISSYLPNAVINQINGLGLSIKKQLKEEGISSRFVALTDTKELSTIQTLKNKLDEDGIEIGLFEDGVGVLVALNDPEKWVKIDYDKPASDKFSGMLPPRLARMMVNVACGQVENFQFPMTNGKFSTSSNDNGGNETPNGSRIKSGMTSGGSSRLGSNDKKEQISSHINSHQGSNENITIVDPFCGSGAVLLEGMQLGFNVIGSDISDKAVKDSAANVAWLEGQLADHMVRSLVFKADATSENFIKKIKYKVGKNLIIVGEPFLGRPKKMASSYEGTINEYKDVKGLYLRFFDNLAKFPLDDVSITTCLVFPLVETKEGKKYDLFKELKNDLVKAGFETIGEPLLYGRDYQVVKRQIIILKKKLR